MGMDVYGKHPANEKGEYFRNNVWWWRPLWDYCCEVAPKLIDKELAHSGHMNDGAGLGSEGSKKLARILKAKLNSGETAKYEAAYKKAMAEIPDEKCEYCGGTGLRTDLEKNPVKCNVCGGKGHERPLTAEYPFSAENVAEFAEFLENCGGFEIC